VDTKEELGETVETGLRRADLWDEVKANLGLPGTSLSGGQQQRLCIARAIANNPEVILMDEPCSALDPKSTEVVEQLMVDLAERYSIVIVTHNMQEAERIAARTAFFYMGEIVEVDATERLFKQARDERTQRYVGGTYG
jgi:phosphate transport system ATP-binding protein